MEKDFDSWNKVKKNTDMIKESVMIREGEIIWCRIGVNIGCETFGKGKYYRRPILVLRKFSKNSFLGVPLTKQEKKGDWYYKIEKDGITNFLILNQTRSFDVKRLENKLYEISEKELLKIKIKYCELILKNTKARI
jgi:mRNA interferase MazF